ncbi:hypothetical protein ACQ4PT_016610 [Festuca glaucescens]
MSSEEEERLMFPSFLFPESFPADAAMPNTDKSIGGEQRKAGRQRRRRKARQVAEGDGDDAVAKKRRLTDDQAQFLEMSFRKERKLETPRKVQLAAELGLDTKQLLRLKEKLAETEEEKGKVMAAAATSGVGTSSPSSSSFSTVTHNAAMVDQFEMEDAEADLTYLSLYDDGDVVKIKKGVKQLMEKVMHMVQDISGSDNSKPTPNISNILAIQPP